MQIWVIRSKRLRMSDLACYFIFTVNIRMATLTQLWPTVARLARTWDHSFLISVHPANKRLTCWIISPEKRQICLFCMVSQRRRPYRFVDNSLTLLLTFTIHTPKAEASKCAKPWLHHLKPISVIECLQKQFYTYFCFSFIEQKSQSM